MSFQRRIVKTDEFGRAKTKCGLCKGTVTVSAFQAGVGNTTAALRRHKAKCVGMSDEARAHFKKHGSWPSR